MKDFMDEEFKDLEQELKMTKESKSQLRTKIMNGTIRSKRCQTKQYLYVAVMVCMAFFILSPFYSTTMAGLAAKVLPISITPSISDGEDTSDLTEQLFKLVEAEGYAVSSVGVLPSPYLIEIALELNDSTLKQATKELEPKILCFLSENGYDSYEVKILQALDAPRPQKSNDLYDQVREIVKEVFTAYGYAEEADHELAGLKTSWISNTVTIDMPDHILESTEIIADIENEIKKEKLKVKDVKVTTFNLEHRQQDNRWAYIVSDIHDALAGKSRYQLEGISYKVKNGRAYVYIKSNLDQLTSKETTEEIEQAIREYLALPEIQEIIRDDKYTIQLMEDKETPFIEIAN